MEGRCGRPVGPVGPHFPRQSSRRVGNLSGFGLLLRGGVNSCWLLFPCFLNTRKS